jgi:hypothetical protein
MDPSRAHHGHGLEKAKTSSRSADLVSELALKQKMPVSIGQCWGA